MPKKFTINISEPAYQALEQLGASRDKKTATLAALLLETAIESAVNTMQSPANCHKVTLPNH